MSLIATATSLTQNQEYKQLTNKFHTYFTFARVQYYKLLRNLKIVIDPRNKRASFVIQ